MRGRHLLQASEEEMGKEQEIKSVQRHIPGEGHKQAATEARLHLCIKQMEVNDDRFQGEMGVIHPPFRAKI